MNKKEEILELKSLYSLLAKQQYRNMESLKEHQYLIEYITKKTTNDFRDVRHIKEMEFCEKRINEACLKERIEELEKFNKLLLDYFCLEIKIIDAHYSPEKKVLTKIKKTK